MTTNRALTLTRVLDRHGDALSASLRVCLPARVESFDPATQLASVKPLLRETREGEEEGEEVVESLPVISGVPVQVLGAGGFRVSFPIEKGTPCLLVFADRSLDLWIESGGDVDPVDARRHALSDAVALLGVRAKPQALGGYDSDAAALRHENGSGVYVTAAGVAIGAKNATEAALKGTTYKAAEDAWLTALSTYLAAIVGVIPGGNAALAASGAPAAYEAAVQAFKAAAALSTSVKVKG